MALCHISRTSAEFWPGNQTTLASMADTRPTRRLLLVEDQTVLRAAVASALHAQGFLVHEAESASAAIRGFSAFDPDVLVADIDLGSRPNGVELATVLRAMAPYLGVVFLTNFPTIQALERTVAPPSGSAFVNKHEVESIAVLVDAIESALDDSRAAVVASIDQDNPMRDLTAAQLAIVRLMADGWTNAEIAARRGSSLRAVERMIARTFEALGLNDDPSRNPRVVASQMYVRTFGSTETVDD